MIGYIVIKSDDTCPYKEGCIYKDNIFMYTTFLEEYHMSEGGDKFKGIAIVEILGDNLEEISYDDDIKQRTNKIRVVKKNLKDAFLSYEANLDKMIAYIEFDSNKPY